MSAAAARGDQVVVPTPKVLFIAGMTRSGTTLLDGVLNELPGFFGGGEVRAYWRAVREARLCGCGVPVPECEFWSAVTGWIERRDGQLSLDKALSLQQTHIRSLPLQLLRLSRAAEHVASPGREYARLLGHVYTAIAAVSGADIVVDSSKGPHDAYVVSKFTDLDVFVVHLVRDPRGVAYSWSRLISNPDEPGSYFEQPSALEVAIRWLARNAITEILLGRHLGPRYMRVRYEDFVRQPEVTIRRVLAMCGDRRTTIPVDRDMIFSGSHSVSGNPRRARTGLVRIRADAEWEERMAPRSKALASIPSAPLLRRYGYRVWPAPAPPP